VILCIPYHTSHTSKCPSVFAWFNFAFSPHGASGEGQIGQTYGQLTHPTQDRHFHGFPLV
jgi:hypothetical protein